MRSRVGLRLSPFLLLLFCATPLLHAQFTEPTQEELKMTADPKAPGAAVVYLYHEQIADDHQQTISYYERIKVLTEKGKEMATIKLPYNLASYKIAEINGRTVHSDGNIFPLTATPADLMDFKAKNFQENMAIFTLPNVAVGSILEYRMKLKYTREFAALPTWHVQQDHFVHHELFSYFPNLNGYSPYINLMRAERLPENAHTAKDKKGVYTLDITDMAPIPDEDWMPPMNTFKYLVDFYITYNPSATEFWKKELQNWMTTADDWVHPSGGLKKAVAEIVAPGDTEEVKAQKIYAALMKLENTNFTRTKSYVERKKEKLKDIHNVDDVWKQKSGNPAEIALLYVAMARAAGLTAWPMQVVDRNRALFDPGYLSLYQLDDYIAIVSINGQEVYLDPGEKMCAFGTLDWRHTLATGIRLKDKVAEQATTPGGNYKNASMQRFADLTVDTDGSVKGTVKFVMTGPQALYWRQVSIQNDAEDLKRKLKESMQEILPEGLQVDLDHSTDLENYNAPLAVYLNVSGNLGTTTGKHIFLPSQFFESHAKHPFVAQEKRLTPIDVHYPRIDQDSVVYHLPDEYTLESAPPNTTVSWPNHAVMKVESQTAKGLVRIGRTSAYNFCLIAPKNYADLHDFYQKQATVDQQQLALVHATAAKGNQ